MKYIKQKILYNSDKKYSGEIQDNQDIQER